MVSFSITPSPIQIVQLHEIVSLPPLRIIIIPGMSLSVSIFVFYKYLSFLVAAAAPSVLKAPMNRHTEMALTPPVS